MNIGKQIKKYRIKANLSQRELGIKLGVSQQQIAQYESGTRVPKIENIQRIALALNVPIAEIWSYPEYQEGIWHEIAILQYIDDLMKKDPEKGIETYQQHLERRVLFSDDIQELLRNYDALNEAGKTEAKKRISELTEIPRYTESQQPEQEIKNTPLKTVVHAQECNPEQKR